MHVSRDWSIQSFIIVQSSNINDTKHAKAIAWTRFLRWYRRTILHTEKVWLIVEMLRRDNIWSNIFFPWEKVPMIIMNIVLHLTNPGTTCAPLESMNVTGSSGTAIRVPNQERCNVRSRERRTDSAKTEGGGNARDRRLFRRMVGKIHRRN